MTSPESDVVGLLLMGGQSSRMGEDKSQLDYTGKPHAKYMFDIMERVLSHNCVSVRSGQECSFADCVIADQYATKGPINGILSAMKANPNKAILVLAVDLPMIQKETIERLLLQRDKSKLATAYALHGSELPEPLIAIWEPASAEALFQHHLEDGKNCPRKFLINSDIKLIYPENDEELFNANTPIESQEAKSRLNVR